MEAMQESESKMVLGTAQLGMHYGIANQNGKPSQTVVNAIISEAWNGGVRQFDTAQCYGESERALGIALETLAVLDQAMIISKIDPAEDILSYQAVEGSVKKSLERLKMDSLHGLLLHREECLDMWKEILKSSLERLKQNGFVRNIGVSVYSPDRALQAAQCDNIDMIQVPTNILDRRFIENGFFELAEKQKKLVYIRSAFLQGLLLLDPDRLPQRLSFAKSALEAFCGIVRATHLSKVEVALAYLKTVAPSAYVVIGAETPEQVRTNREGWLANLPRDVFQKCKDTNFGISEKILNPSLWPQQ